LHEVGTVVGGMLILPATPETIAGFMAVAETAPDEFSAIANVMPAPPMPFVPVEYHGKLIIMAIMVYAGDVAEGQRVVAPFKALATPIADMVRPMPYPEIYPPDDSNYHPTAVSRTMFIDTVDRSVADLILDRLQTSTAQMAAAQLRVLGGAIARVPVEATAYAHRKSKIMVNVAAMFGPAEDASRHQAWVTDFAAALHQSDDGAYVNFLTSEGEEEIHAAYPGATYERLAAIKGRYDPTNLFRLNQNIQPAR
jgi:FAD/FMN-containing dehydrogenase